MSEQLLHTGSAMTFTVGAASAAAIAATTLIGGLLAAAGPASAACNGHGLPSVAAGESDPPGSARHDC